MTTETAAHAAKDAAPAPAVLTATPTCDALGEPCLAVPLSGTDGAGLAAIIDEDALAALQQAGARALYLVKDGRGLAYVTYVRLPSRRSQTAARAIMGDPQARRIEYVNGDRLDLRRRNLRVREYAGVGVSRATEQR